VQGLGKHIAGTYQLQSSCTCCNGRRAGLGPAEAAVPAPDWRSMGRR